MMILNGSMAAAVFAHVWALLGAVALWYGLQRVKAALLQLAA